LLLNDQVTVTAMSLNPVKFKWACLRNITWGDWGDRLVSAPDRQTTGLKFH